MVNFAKLRFFVEKIIVMITFPASKINLGLSILNRREDNYHNIQTVMYPVEGLTDVIEILKSDDSGCQFSSSGLIVDCQPHKNLCVKAYELMRTRYGLGGVKMHLHKKVPFGAGLGGGSADAAAVLNGLNDLFELHLYAENLRSLAAELGSDIPFFIDSQSAVASSRGEVLQPVGLSLAGVNIVIIKPDIFVSTAEAYSGVIPYVPQIFPSDIVSQPIDCWRDRLVNDFEESLFVKFPLLREIKEQLYEMGAIYASMSGSGSAMFGLFSDDVSIPDCLKNHFIYSGVLG